MDSRIFHLVVSLFTATVLVVSPSDVMGQGGRTTYNFNYQWKFLKDNPAEAEQLGFDDESWETVSCPHTFNDIDTFDDYSLGHHNGEANHWRGTVWYRKEFKLPKTDMGKKVFIEFESVRQIADVYLNGKHLGTNRTGFIPFGYDLTPHLKFGDEANVVAVKVNNDRVENFRKNLPLVWHHEHWHPNHGGIYRNVFLHVMDPLRITLPLYDNLKTVGTYVYAENVTKENADITVEAEVRNEREAAQSITFETQIIDCERNVVATETNRRTIGSGETVTLSTKTSLPNPKRWYTRDPYMYTARVLLKDGETIIDSYDSPLGIRTFDFNKDTGFWNNGEYAKLHGWGQKPTHAWPGLGAALPDWLRDFTYNLMDQAGGNLIRWGHCAGSPAEIAMGDKYGFVTMMPGVSGESTDHGETWDVRIAAFRDMIVYYRNHPSIFIWEGGNWAETAPHYEEILQVINTYDPKGKRLMGNRRADVKLDSEKYITIEIGTEGWEREYAHLPIVESEYCRDEAPRRVWDKHSPDDNFRSHPNLKRNTYKIDSEEFAVAQVEQWWNKMGRKTYHVGGANWIFSDGPHGGRCPTEVTRASGEVDAVRLPKEAFYALKAMWRSEPQVHVIGHWNYDKATKKDIHVVSNCAAVKLYVNEKLVGSKKKPEYGYLFSFPNVQWAEGEIKAEGFVGEKLHTTQTKLTTGEPAALKLTPITGLRGWRADGSDIAMIDVEVVDENGFRCPLDKGRVDFQIDGPGTWRGGYNSGKENSTNRLYLDTECGINRVAIRSQLTPGTVTLTATKAGLDPVSIKIQSHAVDINHGLTLEMPQSYAKKSVTPEPMPIHAPEMPAYIPSEQNNSKLFTQFSYTGDGRAMLRTAANWGKKAYTDLELNYTVIPNYLRFSEYVRMPNSDRRYWARDQLQFVAGTNMVIYVGHDDRVPRPEFLLSDYEDTGDDMKLGDAMLSIFKRQAKKGQSIIMAGNSDGDIPGKCKMYVVLGKRIKRK